MGKYQVVVSRDESDEYPYIIVDKSTGEVVDAFPSPELASNRLADYRGEVRRDEYEN